MFSLSLLCHALLVNFHIKLFSKLIFCHSVSTRCWQFVLPLPLTLLSRVTMGLIWLIPPGCLEVLGLQLLCAAITAGSC